MRILLIQTAHAGDALLASSLLADIAERYPLAAVDVLVRQGNEPLFAHNPRVSRVWAWKKQGGKIRNLLALGKAIRAERFDRVYNLQRFASSGYLTWRSGAEFRAGFAQNPWSRSFQHRVEHRIPWPDPSAEGQFLHEVQRNRLLLDEKPAPPRRPEIYPTDQHRQMARKWLGTEPHVVVAPGSRWATKRWPPEKWAELLQGIPDALRVVLVGGPEDRSMADGLRTAHPNAHNACGEADVNTTAALMSGAWHVFANDSLGIHLASAVNAPSTLIYCSTGPELGFYPLSEAGTYAKADVPCCQTGLHGAKACKNGDFRCARALEATSVLKPLLQRWNTALHLRRGLPVRLHMRQSDGAVQPWVLQLATDLALDGRPGAATQKALDALTGESRTRSAAPLHGGSDAANRPAQEPLLWFSDLPTLERQLGVIDPALRRILVAHFRMPFARRACIRMPGLKGLAEGLERRAFGLGGSPEWSALLRCVGAPVLLLPEALLPETDPEMRVLDDAWNGDPPAIPTAQIRWDGTVWKAEYQGAGTEAYAPWVELPTPPDFKRHPEPEAATNPKPAPEAPVEPADE